MYVIAYLVTELMTPHVWRQQYNKMNCCKLAARPRRFTAGGPSCDNRMLLADCISLTIFRGTFGRVIFRVRLCFSI